MKKTSIYKPDDLKQKAVQETIKQTVLSGGTIVFPTETVYGIGAHALNEKGIQNIYAVKGRPSDNPLIMHIANKDDIEPYVYLDQPYVSKLMDAFWPGPLTLVFRKKPVVPKSITGGLDTVGLRLPVHPIAQAVLTIAGVPLCAPSANVSGRPSSTLFEHVLEDFNHKVDVIVDGGKSDVGIESTVLDVTQSHPVILRPGVITKTMLETVVPGVQLSTELHHHDTPKSPGMKYKHYAPKAVLSVVEGDDAEVIVFINEQIALHKAANQTVGVIAPEECIDALHTPHVFNIGKKDNETTIASNLFIALRTMDQWEVDAIYTFSFIHTKYQEAIMNRLLKAANNRIIKL